jgi:single-strand DNA-binding protein
MNFNCVILAGNLTREPETKTVGDTQKARVGLAVNRRYKVNGETKEEVCFIDLDFWGKNAESIAKYGTKGTAIQVRGRLKLDSWTDNAGQKRSRHGVVVDEFQFTSPARRESGADAPNAPADPTPPTAAASAPASADDEPPF